MSRQVLVRLKEPSLLPPECYTENFDTPPKTVDVPTQVKNSPMHVQQQTNKISLI